MYQFTLCSNNTGKSCYNQLLPDYFDDAHIVEQ